MNGLRGAAFQGLIVQFDGDGERNGIVGMVGIDGIVVGIVGNGVAGKGGRVVGKDRFGKEGIWVLGNGGNVDFGSDGNGGSVVVGNGGGNVAVGRGRIVGSIYAGGGAAGVSNS